MANGVCKLTGDEGALVQAHILPEALSSPVKGFPFAQGGEDHPPIRRWTSWYDPNIVTRRGEDILERYDTWAVRELRERRLVWSGWGDDNVLDTEDLMRFPGDPATGVRRIEGIDGSRLRPFFLSLLWRGAASSMPEFSAISLRSSDLRRLRRMLVDGDPAPLHRFPMSLIQLSTRGDVHNFTPIAISIPRDIDDLGRGLIPMFRFYLDGLIVHIRKESSAREVAELGETAVGGADLLSVGVVPFETSWQRSNMEALIQSVTEQWPERLARVG